MNKWTPGPWMYVSSNSANVAGYVVPRPKPDGCGLVTNIAIIRPHKYGALEVEANARLIAACPDLLAACEAMSAHYSASLDYQPAYVALARAAIAKATGEQS
jgi:hypothetical protein